MVLEMTTNGLNAEGIKMSMYIYRDKYNINNFINHFISIYRLGSIVKDHSMTPCFAGWKSWSTTFYIILKVRLFLSIYSLLKKNRSLNYIP